MEAALAAFLAPFLPHLIRLGEKAAEEAGARLGADGWKYAKALWMKLRPKVEEKPAAKEAVADVAERPEDEDALAALRQQLKKLLAADEALAREVEHVWREAEAAGATNVIVTASGERSVAAQTISGSTVTTGDQIARE
jgi:hypothetical protein